MEWFRGDPLDRPEVPYLARENPDGYPPHLMCRHRFHIVPRLSVTGISDSAIEVTYFACSNATYQVQSSTTLNSNDWLPAADPVVGKANLQSAKLAFDGSKRMFHRIRVEP